MRWAAVGCLVANVAAFPWQGTFPELRIDANDTVAAVTETLYALADETEPLTAAQFVASTSEFLGGAGFTKMGPHVLSVLRRHGLVDTSRVFEVGFGGDASGARSSTRSRRTASAGSSPTRRCSPRGSLTKCDGPSTSMAMRVESSARSSEYPVCGSIASSSNSG